MSGWLERLGTSARVECVHRGADVQDPKGSSLESQGWQHKPHTEQLPKLRLTLGALVLKVTSVLKVRPDTTPPILLWAQEQ